MRITGISSLGVGSRGSARLFGLYAMLGLVLLGLPSAALAEQAPLVLILDASGSMWGQVDGENKIVIARQVLGELIDELPAGAEVGLVAYGHRRKGDCTDIETLAPIGPVQASALKASVNALQPKGKTPLTASVDKALDLVRQRGEQSTVILLSDGLETCGGDPCKAVRLAREAGVPLVLHVVGFDVEGEDLSQLQCMAQAGGGLFLNAEDAGELGAALDAAVALPVDAPVGRLAVRAIADGELEDVSVRVTRPDGTDAGVARTYERAETNPTSIPLADGTYEVRVLAVGLKGDRERRFTLEIADGNTVEKEVDYSTGELSIGVQRNGELSDAVYKVYVAGTSDEVASGRTYTKEKHNPAKVRLTAGRYDVKVGSVEIAGKPWHSFDTVELPPQGSQALSHGFESSTLTVGAVRSGERVDAVVHVVDAATGKAVAQGRTYKGPPSNPKTFEVAPGSYEVRLKTVGKDSTKRQIEITLKAGQAVAQDVDFDQGETQ